MKRFLVVSLLSLSTALSAMAQPSEKQVAADASNFHRFRITALAKATEIDKKRPGENAGVNYLGIECKKLAQRTSPDYLYGIVTDLIQDTSRTEEPYQIAIMVLDNYPPNEARAVIKKILADPRYSACGDVKDWDWEIDEAQKGKTIAK